MKVKVSDKQLTEWVKEVIDGVDVINEDVINGVGIITEDTSLTNSDVKSIVKREIREFLNMTQTGDLEKKIKEMVKEAIKSDKDLEKNMVEISKNVLVQLYKNLWTRRSFWTNDLKNSPN